MPRNLSRHLLPVVLLVVATGCGGSSAPTTPTPASVAGTWNLQTINGQSLPFVIAQTGTNQEEIASDQLLVGSGGTFTETTVVKLTVNGQVSEETLGDAGSYSLNGTAVTFVFASDGSSGTGTLTGNTLTVAEGGYSEVYKKQ